MPITKQELEEMNDLLAKGKTVADLAKKYSKYDYWEIYWQVSDYSFLGKKRMISNRLRRLVSTKPQAKRQEIATEAKELLDELYKQLKSNSAKLIEINRIIQKK
jgi:hypothetical protein